jgi:hypothetical protein
MPKAFWKVVGHSEIPPGVKALVPSDGQTREMMRRFVPSDIISTSAPSKPRNPKHSAKFWKLMHVVWESTAVQDRYASPRALAKAIEVVLGHFDAIKLPDGRVITDIHSLSFDSMNQERFAEFYSGAIDMIVTEIIPHINREDLEREVERMIGHG